MAVRYDRAGVPALRGEYVLASDYDALAARCAELEIALRQMIEPPAGTSWDTGLALRIERAREVLERTADNGIVARIVSPNATIATIRPPPDFSEAADSGIVAPIVSPDETKAADSADALPPEIEKRGDQYLRHGFDCNWKTGCTCTPETV